MMKPSIGDRWIHDIITRVQVNNDSFTDKMWFILGFGKLILFTVFFLTGDNLPLLLYSALVFLFAGVINFERRKFVTIIRTQMQEIQKLQVQLAEKESTNR